MTDRPRIFYIVNARIPTEKAHGLTIAKSCEAFAHAGARVTLVVPARRTHIEGDIYGAYGVERVFETKFLWTIDAFQWIDGRLAFVFQVLSFYVSVMVYMLFRSRNVVVYTRDISLCALALFGFSIFYECHRLPKRKRLFYWLAHCARGVVVISHALERSFLETGFSTERILVAPSGVDLSIFEKRVPQEEARRTLELPRHVPLAVYTGNFTTFGEDKGIADIIAALQNMPSIFFFAIGGSDADIARYRSMARERNVEERVILRGRAPQQTLALAQQAADMLLMPFPDTPHYRSHMSPVKMFEYMASGKPIIASNLPTIREVLNEENAIIVPPGDPEAMTRGLEHACTNPVEAARKAAIASATVGDYTWERRTRRIINFITV